MSLILYTSRGKIHFDEFSLSKGPNMKLILLIFCGLILGFPGMLSAELYKYYDQKGSLCFTDDLSMVPPDQRPAVETIYEIQTKPEDSLAPDAEPAAKSNPGPAINTEVSLKSELEQESLQLGVIKKQLDDAYIALKGRQDLLILDEKSKKNTAETKVYNQQVNELDRDILNYKEKQEIYRKKVEAYNLKLESAP